MESGAIIPGGSRIRQVDGNYFVNIDIGDDGATDRFVVYPLTATIKTSSLDADSLATFPGTGVIAITDFADFADWNDGNTLTFTGTVDAATATSPSGIMDGILRTGETRALGTHFFIAAIAPKITTFGLAPTSYSTAKFDPGTAAAPTPLVFTFSKAMNTALGTLKVKDNDGTPEDYLFTVVWSAGNTVFTATPSQVSEYGKTISAAFTGFESADGVPFGTTTYSFTVRPALHLLTANTWTAYGSSVNTVYFAVDGDLILIFNVPLVEFDPFATYLQDANSQFIPSTVTISGNTLTINPTSSLANNVACKVIYSVKGKLFENVDVLSDGSSRMQAIRAGQPGQRQHERDDALQRKHLSRRLTHRAGHEHDRSEPHPLPPREGPRHRCPHLRRA